MLILRVFLHVNSFFGSEKSRKPKLGAALEESINRLSYRLSLSAGFLFDLGVILTMAVFVVSFL